MRVQSTLNGRIGNFQDESLPRVTAVTFFPHCFWVLTQKKIGTFCSRQSWLTMPGE